MWSVLVVVGYTSASAVVVEPGVSPVGNNALGILGSVKEISIFPYLNFEGILGILFPKGFLCEGEC